MRLRKQDLTRRVNGEITVKFNESGLTSYAGFELLIRYLSRRGNCWDNAVAESFFSSLKVERVRGRIYSTRDEARADLFDYIELFYNPKRRHSYVGGVSPEAFERASNHDL